MAVTFTASGSPTAGGVQQAYELKHDPLLEGQLSDIRDNTIGTYVNESGGVLAFGNVLSYDAGGTVDNSAGTISGATSVVVGVNVLRCCCCVCARRCHPCHCSARYPHCHWRAVCGSIPLCFAVWQDCPAVECPLPHFCRCLWPGDS